MLFVSRRMVAGRYRASKNQPLRVVPRGVLSPPLPTNNLGPAGDSCLPDRTQGSRNAMDHTKPSSSGATREEVHASQARMVADSVMHETGHEVYRRRLLGGVAAAQVRDAVRTAVNESLRRSCTHAEAAEAGALAADHALGRVGIEVERIGFQRMGWRGRLAHVLWNLESGNVAVATSEVRDMIDGIYEK